VWFAQRAVHGAVDAIDVSRAWLGLALDKVREAGIDNVRLLPADARALPFEDQTFDVVWCAQSLYCLPDVDRCLAEMLRVLRMGGTLAVLEDDTLHQILLPWPVDLELMVRAAELRAFEAEDVAPARFYIGRWTSRL